jgi:FecR protein
MTIFQKARAKFPRRRVQLARPAGPVATAILCLVALCSLALANDPIFRVARISLVEGEVSYQQAKDSGKDWFDATLNLPLEENDQLYSGSDGRAEIQLSGRNVARIDRDTNLRFTQFNAGVIQIALPIGSAHFRIDSLDKRQFEVVDANEAGADDPVYFEVDTPTVAVTLVKEGVYRINVLDDGSTEVIVRQGEAEVYSQGIGTVVVKKGRRIVVEGSDDLYKLAGLEDDDDWDRWNDRRDKGLFSNVDSSDSAEYIPDAIPGVYDLDNYGEWIDTPEYGRMWSPRGVAADWAPYRDGYWRWFPSYGWTWVSYEPWGWTPYHYGRWAYVRNRWCWAPFANINPGFGWRWRPHHVAFFGWGGSYNSGYRDGVQDGYWKGFRDGRYGYLGWCPLSPRDRHYEPRNNGHRLESLGNYNAPGGFRGMDARRFTGGRVAVSRDALNAPLPLRREIAEHRRIDRDNERGEAALAFVRNEDFKPLQPIAATRSDAVARGRFARRIERPIVFRRTPNGAGGAATHGFRPIREGRARDGQTTPAPIRRSDDSNPSPPARISNDRIERPSRMPDYRRPERVETPPPRPRDQDRSPSERAKERGDERDNQRRDESPSRSERRSDNSPQRHDPPVWKRPERREESQDSAPSREKRRDDPPRDNSPRRNDDAQRRFDPPAWRGGERREERRDSDSHRERRRDDSPRDNSSHREMRRPDPPRSSERPSSPPPQSAPPRALERQHSPSPARERPTSRPAERPPERPKTRRPNMQ